MSKLLAGSRASPAVVGLVAVNCLIFLLVTATGSADWVKVHFGLLPSHVTQLYDLNPMFLLSIFTSAFVHIDPMHLFMNVLPLIWAGLIVERYVGTLRFALLYAAAIFVCAGVEIIQFAHTPQLIVYGASGAVGALIGAAGVVLISERLVTVIDLIGSTLTLYAVIYVATPLLQPVLPAPLQAGATVIVLWQVAVILLRGTLTKSLLTSAMVGWAVVQTSIDAYLSIGQPLPLMSVAWDMHAAGLIFGALTMFLLPRRWTAASA